MNLTKILEDLRREREQIDEAIFSLERLASGAPRRGRPPGWLKAHQETDRPSTGKDKDKPGAKSASGD